MQSFVPPVVDHVKRSTIETLRSKSPFSILNIVALVAILIIGYFLYKKFTAKFSSGSIKMARPPVRPRAPPKKVTFKPPVVEESEESEDEEDPGEEEDVPDVDVKED
jgi:hypothetical protein